MGDMAHGGKRRGRACTQVLSVQSQDQLTKIPHLPVFAVPLNRLWKEGHVVR